MSFLEYGWPINFSSAVLPKSTFQNHSSSLKRPDIIDDHIKTELQNAAIIGPFQSNPFSSECVVSPLQVVIKDSTSKPRIVHDLSFLKDFLLMTVFQTILLNDSFKLRLPGVDRLIEFIREKGKGCHIFKADLRRAFRQIPVDPADIPLLGFQVNDLSYFHVVLPFGLRSAVLICQRKTKAVVFILTKDNNVLVAVYIDDFFGAATAEEAPFVYNKLLLLLQELGLQISPEKCFQPSTRMICLGILFDTEVMTISVPEDKVVKLKEELSTWLSRSSFNKRQLQSLLGKLSYVTACVQPGRIFTNRLLNVLRSFMSRKKRLPVTKEMRNDILWWLHFLDLHNGVYDYTRIVLEGGHPIFFN